MKTLKWMYLAAVAVLAPSLASCDKHDDQPISPNALPTAAQQFVKQYYADATIIYVEKDKDHYDGEYDVTLSNATEITFDRQGNWVDVDAPKGQTIPDGIAPATIASYVTTNYTAPIGINEISKERFGYEVELTTGLDLRFDANGTYLGLDH